MKKSSFIFVAVLVLVGGLAGYKIAEAVRGEGTATIAKDGGAQSGGVTVVQSTSHTYTVILMVGASGITANAENPTFTIPAGFTAPDATYVANAGLVVADGNWSVIGGGTCLVESPVAGLTKAVGQVITVDVSTMCTVGGGGTITLTYKGTSATVGVTSVDVGVNDVISYTPVKSISLAPNNATLPTVTVTSASATLNVIKHVVTDNGGIAVASNFTMNVTGTNVSNPSFVGAEGGTTVTLDAGSYSVDENAFSGYTKSLGANCSGTIAAGETKTCTITNDDNAPSLTLNKIVVNGDGGAASESEWTLTATGPTTISGPGAAGSTDVVSGASFDQGTYTLSESGPTGYTASAWSCTNGITVNGSSRITLGLGQTTVCTITNNDIPPSAAILHIIKHVITDDGGTADASDFTMTVTGTNVSDPSFAGVESPGTTVTLDAGSYSVDEAAFSGYTKSLSADCSGTAVAGETKTCTITNDDIAETVSDETDDEDDKDVDIKVTKKANPSVLHSGPGSVTYTYKVTNEGDVPLIHVSVKDDKCSSVEYISGDKNHNKKLGVDEVWKYACTKTVSRTETNTATARGSGNGKVVRDTDRASVAVSVPSFPNAGVGPEEEDGTPLLNFFHLSAMLQSLLFRKDLVYIIPR